MSYQDQPCNIMGCLPMGASLEPIPTEEITDLTGTTWYLNENISVADLHDESADNYSNDYHSNSYNISFVNEAQEYYSDLTCKPPFINGTAILNGKYNLNYRNDLVYSESDNSWLRSFGINDRTIIILGGTDVTNSNLIAWFQSNATRITINRTSNIIEFTVSGTTYQAEEGMNWVEWCDSEYNTGNFRTSGLTGSVANTVGNSGKIIYYDSGRNQVYGGTYIESNHAYYGISPGAGN